MKVVVIALVFVLLTSGLALAQDGNDRQDQMRKESAGVFKTILHVVLNWVFPVGAAYCFIYGVVSRGVKRGEWDMAAICVIAAVGLALFPKILGALFNFELK